MGQSILLLSASHRISKGRMIALLLSLVSILTPGFGQTFPLFNSSSALSNLSQDYTVVCPPNPDPDIGSVFVPHPHDCTKYYECQGTWPILLECPHELYFDPVLNVCNWPEEVDCTAKCSVEVVFADDDLGTLTTWSPEKHCKVETFQGFPPLVPENIYQCSNGQTFIKSQKDGITELSFYTGVDWEPVIMPPEIANVNKYALTTIPNQPYLILAGGELEFLDNGIIQVRPVNGICVLDCKNFINDGSAWTCLSAQLCRSAYDSCATASDEFVTVIAGKRGPSTPFEEVGFYPITEPSDHKCVLNSVDFIDGVQDCISPRTSHVYAIGTEKMYLMNPKRVSVRLLEGTLPVTATPSNPVRMFYDPETSKVNVIGGTSDGIIPSCYTWFYTKHKWNRGIPCPCWAGRVLGRL